jgi:hypothetical protein
MTLRLETLALKNTHVNPDSLMTRAIEYKSTHTLTSGGIQCKNTD